MILKGLNGRSLARFISPTSLMVLILLVAGIINILWGEGITVNGGLGWDGSHFGKIVRNLPALLSSESLNSYRVGRIVPAAVVHYALRLFDLPPVNNNVIIGFKIYDLLLLCLVAILWGKIAKELKISTRGIWLGFIGLFFNYALRFNFYYPVLTDVSAFALGMLLVYFYLKDNHFGILITSIIGAFVWPTIFIFGMLLYVFPKQKTELSPAKYVLHHISASLLCGLVTYLFIYFYFELDHVNYQLINDSVVYLSFVIVLMYFFLMFSTLFNYSHLFDIKHLINSIMKKRLVMAGIAFLSTQLLITYFSNNEPAVTTSLRFLESLILLSILKPFIFGLAHILFYGPILIFCFFLWGEISDDINKYGYGLTMYFTLGLILTLTAESRQLISFFPIVLVFTVKATEKLNWKSSYFWFIAFLSFLASKFWLRFNNEPLVLKESKFEFPWQKLFSSIGHHISDEMYLLQGGLVLLSTVVIYFLFFHENNKKIQ